MNSSVTFRIDLGNLNKAGRQAANKISAKFHRERGARGSIKNRDFRLINFDQLFRLLEREEKELAKAALSLRPENYGIRACFLGIEPVPKNLVAISGQSYSINGETKKIEFTHFLLKNHFSVYSALNKKMKNDTSREINVYSGYRSPAFQIMLFISLFVENNFDVKKTLRRVALPAYSEHCNAKRQAIDVAPCHGIADLKNFYKTKEYQWLSRNAKEFGLYLSYPPNNKMGMDFEPWHWHFENV